MKKILISLILVVLFVGCAPSQEVLEKAISETIQAYTPIPSQTPYPTQTPAPTIVITKVVVQTPKPDPYDKNCIPMTQMDYSEFSKITAMLKAYVATLPGVKRVSETIGERLYSNTTSELFFVKYVDSSDGEMYSKRYIVYKDEFGWKKGVFSIDGQCWIDGPK